MYGPFALLRAAKGSSTPRVRSGDENPTQPGLHWQRLAVQPYSGPFTGGIQEGGAAIILVRVAMGTVPVTRVPDASSVGEGVLTRSTNLKWGGTSSTRQRIAYGFSCLRSERFAGRGSNQGLRANRNTRLRGDYRTFDLE